MRAAHSAEPQRCRGRASAAGPLAEAAVGPLSVAGSRILDEKGRILPPPLHAPDPGKPPQNLRHLLVAAVGRVAPATQPMSGSDVILYSREGHVVTITYNRPESMNAINGG